MSKLFIEDSTLSAIGDAIRTKTGGTDLLNPLDMAAAIESIVATGGSGGGSVKMPDIIISGATKDMKNTSFYCYQVYDVTDYSQITFKYTTDNPSGSNYKSKFTLKVSPGYNMVPESGDYGRYEYKKVDTTGSQETVISASNAIVTNVEKTYDVSNMTTLVIELWLERYSTYATGSLRIHDIVLS